jgi:LuxR family transcriptional regulator, maltose regulon positive regulatory protein
MGTIFPMTFAQDVCGATFVGGSALSAHVLTCFSIKKRWITRKGKGSPEGKMNVQTLSTAALRAMPKITMPWICPSNRRQKIFAHLDQLTSFALIWISAPAGYGKSTAISNYLRERHRPTIWYQCDGGDADVASFFHYATLARQLGHSDPIPAFLPQYLTAAPAFCRNFFRAWFAGLPTGSTLVLDNWQDVPPCAELRSLLPVIAEQLPQGIQLVVISRDEPDASMSRLMVAQRLAQIGIEDLQLSRSETEAIVLSQLGLGHLPPLDLDALYCKTQGWVAAVTLLMRHRDIASACAPSGPLGASQTIFDYLASEVFERLEARIQDFLMSLACLEHIAVPVARRASGREEAGSILENLTRQNVFTSYRAVSNSYHFHPLFRTFLQRRLEAVHGKDNRRERLLSAARALSAEGEAEAGIHLLVQACSWREAGHLIGSIASAFVDQSRLKALSLWIDALPADLVADDAWLAYWRGICRLTLDFPCARGDLECSYHRFHALGDRAGQALACAAILQHIAYTYLDYRDMLPWIGSLECLLEDAPQFDSSRSELKVHAAYMLALSQAIPNHPQLMDSVARVVTLTEAERDLVSIADGVSALLHFFSRFGRTPQYGGLDTIIARLLDDPGLPPIHRLNILWLHAYQLHSSGDPARVVDILREARALARHEGLHSDDTRMKLCELQAQEAGLANGSVLATFSELERGMRAMPAIPRAHFLYVRSIFELGRGNLQQALRYGEEALPLIRASHWYIGQALSLTGLAEVYCAVGRYEDAAKCLRECDSVTHDVVAPLVEFNVQLVRAELARCEGRSEDLATALARAFLIGREQGYANGFHTSSQLLRRLIPYGIELGIERSYCQWVIAKRRFTPPSPHHMHWPWPVKIRAMGRLRIYLQDEELIVSGKAQRKPLELLKLLAAHPRGVETSRIMDELWEHLDGDAARNALDIALHRLRKMLKNKDAVLLINGNVSLNKEMVWLDTDALERISSSHASDDREELLELYRGGLLADEQVGSMMLVARERSRLQFIQRVSQVARKLADSHRWDEVTSWYLRAIEREPIEESLHRGLMHSLWVQGRDIRPASNCWESLRHGSGPRKRTDGHSERA